MLIFNKGEEKDIPIQNYGFEEGGIYPSDNEEVLKRIAKYKRGKMYFEGDKAELFERATKVLLIPSINPIWNSFILPATCRIFF